VRVIAYADPHEVKYINEELTSKNTWWVGLGCKNLTPPQIPFIIGDTTEIVLFGSCGLLQNWDKGKLISPRRWYNENDYYVGTDSLIEGVSWWGVGVTVEEPCRDRKKILSKHPEAVAVDMESYVLGSWCATRGIKFQSVKYAIDLCGRFYPPIINKVWKVYQHKLMQRMFLEIINH
jgi:hypothetical protein